MASFWTSSEADGVVCKVVRPPGGRGYPLTLAMWCGVVWCVCRVGGVAGVAGPSCAYLDVWVYWNTLFRLLPHLPSTMPNASQEF